MSSAYFLEVHRSEGAFPTLLIPWHLERLVSTLSFTFEEKHLTETVLVVIYNKRVFQPEGYYANLGAICGDRTTNSN